MCLRMIFVLALTVLPVMAGAQTIHVEGGDLAGRTARTRHPCVPGDSLRGPSDGQPALARTRTRRALARSAEDRSILSHVHATGAAEATPSTPPVMNRRAKTVCI